MQWKTFLTKIVSSVSVKYLAIEMDFTDIQCTMSITNVVKCSQSLSLFCFSTQLNIELDALHIKNTRMLAAFDKIYPENLSFYYILKTIT